MKQYKSDNGGPAGDRVREVLQRSHHVVMRVYDEAGNMIETHEHEGEFKEW